MSLLNKNLITEIVRLTICNVARESRMKGSSCMGSVEKGLIYGKFIHTRG